MLCLICLKETNEAIITSSEMAEIIAKYFWFDMEEINSVGKRVCCDCWLKLKTFHEFYRMVEQIHCNYLSEADNVTESDMQNISEIDIDESCVFECKKEPDDKPFPFENLTNKIQSEVLSSSLKCPIPSKSSKRKQSVCKTDTKSKRGRPKINRTVEAIVCFMCGKTVKKSYKSFSNLRRHFLTHDSDESKQFECKQPNNYSSKPRVQILQKNKPQKLEESNSRIDEKTLKNASLLAQHAPTHSNRQLPEVQCDICYMWLKTHYLLFVHRKIHNKFPQKCPHCDKLKFNLRSLRSHIAFSHGIRIHQCIICGKSFNRPKKLKEHMAGHTGQTLYDCLYCPKSFNNDANMYKHMRLKHSKKWNIDRLKKKSKLK